MTLPHQVFERRTAPQMAKLTSPEMLAQGVPLAQLPSEAGSKRSQPEYPTQEDVAAAPPLKRIKPNEPPSHPFAFDFQQPGQPSAEQPGSAAAHDQPFVFTAVAQPLGSAPSRQNSWQHHGHGANAGAQPQSLTPTGHSLANNPFMGLGGNSNGNHAGSMSALPPGSLPHSVYQGFAPPHQHLGHPAPHLAHLAINAAAAYGQSFYGSGVDASLTYPYGMQPPSHHMGFSGMHHPSMHASYAAFAGQAMPTQYPYPPQFSAPYQQTPSLNSQPSSELPPPPPPFPPV